MSYPYTSLLSLLELRCTPDEYRRLTAPHVSYRRGIKKPHPEDPYWQVIPHYVYAHCPMCHVQYREPADTYSIRGWGSPSILRETLYVLPGEYPTNPPCPHFLGIHTFLNLHGNLPSELTYLENSTGEVPYLTPWFFPIDIESYAVLHALPICRIEAGVSVELVQPGIPVSHALPIFRIEADRFVPSYTVFSLTYFSQQPKEVLRRHYAEEAERGKGDPEYFPATVHPPRPLDTRGYDETLYDLPAWAARGQLGWIDFTQANTPLQIGVGSQLPEIYRQIQGSRKTYVWRNGEMRPW